ncbi:PREDICTED: homeobox protein Mohawk-like [Cyprinodon variegatus]|uniref:homeobox protein Mohawk-like n=1 Tax=Cyprinodon variegatus TaxID=28743 RepID=UPI0007425C75|nr:PREDICTED: homeobox protein Mohawk-like [Cyprinodon variegatus]
MFAEDTLSTERTEQTSKTTKADTQHLLNKQFLKGCSGSPLTRGTLPTDLLLSLLSETTELGSRKRDHSNGGVAATQEEKAKAKDVTQWKEINAVMALTNLAQGKDGVSGTTSCIIQKSSHIAEVKTVKVPFVTQF